MANRLKHLAIIMDGNGRWAKQHGLARAKGHEQGAQVVRDVTRYCADHPTIETLTLYAFSTENWKRPKMEVDFLMRLLDRYLAKEIATCMEYGIRFDTIGDIGPFSSKLKKTITEAKKATINNTRLTQILALNYGGRDEIVRAANRLIAEGKAITEQSFAHELDTPYSDVDLMIRTSGEQRLSNFLLWQLSYSELCFTETLWPDFTPDELEKILADFLERERKYGGI